MKKITIFDAEIEAGIGEQIRSQASIAYVSPLCISDNENENKSGPRFNSKLLNELKSTASAHDKDVYQTHSILVSTSWNKNDDVFTAQEVWKAKDTPIYKPANLEHDEKKIVGGIIGSWPVDEKLNLIQEDISLDNLPDYYHILVSSVIYNQWQDREYKARAEELIEKIEKGEMFVSMECLFSGFDYAVISPDNKNHIVARTNDTAFLSRHLRAYGGTGDYQNHKIGRLLKSINFSGKGFVEKPANPDSIIFDAERDFDFANASISKNLFSTKNSVYFNVEDKVFSSKEKQENFNMSNDILSAQISELKESLATLKSENKELSDKLAAANVGSLETQISDLEQQVESLSASLSESVSSLEAAEAKIAELEISAETGAQALAEANSTIESMVAEQLVTARKQKLVEAGLSEEEALAKLEIFDGLSDEQFEAVAETISAAVPMKKLPAEKHDDKEEKAMKMAPKVKAEKHDEDEEKKEKGMKMKPIKAEEAEEVEETEAQEIDEEVLETASVEESIDMSIASEELENETEHVRAGLRDWVSQHVLKNKQGELE